MNKYLLTLALTGITLGASAAVITPEEALLRLGSSPSLKSLNGEKIAPKLVHTEVTQEGSPAIYVFNKGNKAGYLLLSADDQARPLLGYCDEGSFNEENMPPQMKWWLSEYTRQIQMMSQNSSTQSKAKVSAVTRADREPIAPMIQTKWDQGEPYNLMCPKSGTVYTYTGCVATCMAQIMNYWKYPEVGQGTISYNCESLGKRLALNFSQRKIEWDKMLDTYLPGQYTKEQSDAVAYLMKAAGYSVKMDYSTESSGALAMNIANGFVKYFNYDGNIRYEMRELYSPSQWEQMMYDNLKNVGPIPYGGGSLLGGGHSFVLDGYDGNGMFHFNWGWSGMSDGYFALDALNPASLGAGGGSGGGYNFTQDAVLGIQPPTGQPVTPQPVVITQTGSLAGRVTSEGVLQLVIWGSGEGLWVNYNPQTMDVFFGMLIEPQGDTPGTAQGVKVYPDSFTLRGGEGIYVDRMEPTVDLNALNLADGTYKVSAAFSLKDDPDNWTPIRNCYSYYTYVIVKKTGSKYEVTVEPIPEMVLDIEAKSKLYDGCLNKFYIEVKNDSDWEVSKGFAPAFLIDTDEGKSLAFMGESVRLTIPAHSVVSHEWSTTLTQFAQLSIGSLGLQLDMCVFDEEAYDFYIDPDGNYVTLNARPALPTVSAASLPMINNADMTETEEQVSETESAKVYLVKDPSNIETVQRYKVDNGYFAYTVMMCVIQEIEVDGQIQSAIINYAGEPTFISSNRIQTLRANISFPSAEPGVYYYIAPAYLYAGMYFVPIGTYKSWFRLDTTDVKEIQAEEIGDGQIYNLQGIALGKDLDILPAGLYIRNGKKILKR